MFLKHRHINKTSTHRRFEMAQQHHQQNAILYTFDLPEWVRQKSNTNVNELLHAFNVEIPRNDEASLNTQFGKRCEQVASGYAWLQKVYQLTGRKTYGPAMRHYPPYHQLTEDEQQELDKKVNYVKTIYQRWDDIITLCNRSDMVYVDVRRFSLFQLSRACEKVWMEKYNTNHMPRSNRVVRREYESDMIDRMVNNENGATQELLQQVNNNKEQIALIGRDITKALHRRAEGYL